MANDAIDPTDSTFEDHWDKLEIKLNEWVKSSLPGLVTSIMQSHVTKIVDDHISSTEFQRSLTRTEVVLRASWLLKLPKLYPSTDVC